MDEKQLLADAYKQMEQEAVHPSPAEIGEAVEGLGSDFTRTEVRAHLEWCGQCNAMAEEFREFCSPPASAVSAPPVDAAWRRIRKELPRKERRFWSVGWAQFAVGLAACALSFGVWRATLPAPVQQDPIRSGTVTTKAPISDSSILELLPQSFQVRGERPPDPQIPSPAPGSVTLLLNGTGLSGGEVDGRVSGKVGELWSGRLKRQGLAFALSIPGETLQSRPLEIVLTDAQGHVNQYRLP